MIPRFALVKQTLPDKIVDDIPGEVRLELARIGLAKKIRPGMTIAITAGSRGVNNYPLILKTVVAWLQELGAEPFIVPTMGSHGGATAEGQIEVLQGLGITLETVGAPIKSSMDVVQLGQTEQGTPVYLDAYAAQADGIIAVARIKPHTDFRGPIESGLLKMVTIGLGKHKQALAIHRYGVKGLKYHIPEVAQVTLAKAPILLGLGILENGYDQTAKIVAVRPQDFAEQEPLLLEEARTLMPSLPMEELDVLLVGEIGKNFSGTGMDTNIIGRVDIYGEPEFERPRIQYIIALDLSEAAHGNALGIGLADLTTDRLVKKINYPVMRENVLTSSFINRGKIPLALDNDREAILAAQRCLWLAEPEQARMAYIPNTLDISKMLVSESVLFQLGKQDGIEILSDLDNLSFDRDGNLMVSLD